MSRYFNVLWRVPQARKHKTWDADGALTVQNDNATLYNEEGACIGTSNIENSSQLSIEATLKVGSKECIIDEILSEEAFHRQHPEIMTRNAVSASESKPSHLKPVKLSSTSSSRQKAGRHPLPTVPHVKRPAETQLQPPVRKPLEPLRHNAEKAYIQVPQKPPANSSVSKAFRRPTDGKSIPVIHTQMKPHPSIQSQVKPAKRPSPWAKLESEVREERKLSPSPSLENPQRAMSPVAQSEIVVPDQQSETASRPPQLVGTSKNASSASSILSTDLVLPPLNELALREHGKDPSVQQEAVKLDLAKFHTLRPHQIDGVRFMYECLMGMRFEGCGCILADDMGVGKTHQAIALIWTLLTQHPFHAVRARFRPQGHGIVQRVLVLCPVSLIDTWKRQIRTLAGNIAIVVNSEDDLQYVNAKVLPVIIMGYERFRSCVDKVGALIPSVDLVICDEGHRLKSPDSQIYKAVQSLNARRRVLLTGTPLQNNLAEFHAVVDLINPGLLDSYAIFKKHFEMPILEAREKQTRECFELEILQDISKQFILRRLRSDVTLALPPQAQMYVLCRPSSLQASLYKDMLTGCGDLANSSEGEILSKLLELRKLCTSPALVDRRYAKDGVEMSGKLRVMAALLGELWRAPVREKVVIVSNFTTTLDLIQDCCAGQDYPVVRLDGNTAKTERTRVVDTVNHDPAQFVCLLSSKSGGVGLNLIGASRLILVDADWNPANDEQAVARIHRDGQTRPCFVYRLVTAGTIDEKILQRQIAKNSLASNIMQGTAQGSFHHDDLRDLFSFVDGVDSETHMMLNCRCKGDERPRSASTKDEMHSSSDDEATLHRESSIVWASQLPSDEYTETRKRQLEALNDWHHYDQEAFSRIPDATLRRLAAQTGVSFVFYKTDAKEQEK